MVSRIIADAILAVVIYSIVSIAIDMSRIKKLMYDIKDTLSNKEA